MQVFLGFFIRTFVMKTTFCYNVACKEVNTMREQKYYIVFDRYEQGTMINALNEMRNHLIAERRYTDVVDELIIKICNAKTKKFKII